MGLWSVRGAPARAQLRFPRAMIVRWTALPVEHYDGWVYIEHTVQPDNHWPLVGHPMWHDLDISNLVFVFPFTEIAQWRHILASAALP
jgi:hypothetical protein